MKGKPNKLYSHIMLPKDHFEQIFHLFGNQDSTVTIGQFMSERYALFVDFRSSRNHMLHGSGRPIKRLSDGIPLHIVRKADGMGNIRCYVYLLSDAQLNILGGRFHSLEY